MNSYKTICINKKQVRLHRYIMECFLGRKLKTSEIVHHKNNNIHDNRIKNLEITNQSSHMKHHQKISPFGKRFEQIYNINHIEVLEYFKNMGIREIAKIYGCSAGTIQNIIKKYNIREQIICNICGDYATYRKKQLCSKHYLKKYYQKHKTNR